MCDKSALLAILVIAAFLCPMPAHSEGEEEFFESRVRPVLAKHCFACHTNSELGGLRLDTRVRALKGGKTGPAVVPGNVEESLLLRAVAHTDARLKMPPQGKLSDSSIADLTAWIEKGAVWPEGTTSLAPAKEGEYRITAEQRAFWAFQRVKSPPVPSVTNRAWARTDIDLFILSALERKGLKPARAADKHTLLRRATFDLIGLPPTYEETQAFLKDDSPQAFDRVVDRLLASPHYGERWGRHWLDLARYSDGELGASKDTPYEGAFRYRDWVVRSFNEDLPYDLFVKAQIAADHLPTGPQRDRLLPGLGFQALGLDPDERLDVTTRVFLGLTVGCAQCHDHKYDPIPTKDYYSLVGVFRNSPVHKYPLAEPDVVRAYDEGKKKMEDAQFELDEFVHSQSTDLGRFLAAKSARYLVAAWRKMRGENQLDGLDAEIADRWVTYLKSSERDHAFLRDFDSLIAGNASLEQVTEAANAFQRQVTATFSTKRAMDERNYVAMKGVKGLREESIRQYTNLESLPIQEFYLWRDLASEPYKREVLDFKGGVYHFGKDGIGRFLAPAWKEHFETLKADVLRLKNDLPTQYPLLHTLKDAEKIKPARVAIRGDKENPGEEVPRRFLRILSDAEPQPFANGSGRLELAEATASANNPLSARVAVNRVWQLHFGEGLVRTPGNFGQLGERPTHPELLDYLADRFVANGWSLKALHRDIMLSSVYRLSSNGSPENSLVDAENRLLWRANLKKRLDAEALRDSLLAVANTLDRTIGGPPAGPAADTQRRTIYATVERTKPDPTLALFDFPNPNSTSEQRLTSLGPMHRLYFLNSGFVSKQSGKIAVRLEAQPESERLAQLHRMLFARDATKAEGDIGRAFLETAGNSWPLYIQVLLSSAEFSSIP